MSKGVVLGGYQISNALIAALLVASTTGAGVATDSFSGVTEGFDNPLSGPSDNVTQNNQTDDSTDSSDSDSDSSDNQDSSDDGSDSSDSDSDSSDSSGSDTDSSDGSDSDLSDSSDSEDEGGFLDDVLGGDDEQDSENQTDEQDNQNQDETQNNETEDTDSSDNTTDSSVELPYIYQPDPAGTGPGQKIYDTMSVPVEIELIGENANYEVKIDGETYFEGSLEGEEIINTTVDMSNTGKHELEVDLTSSGEVLESVTRTFNISETTEDSTEFEWLGTVTANTDVGLRLWGDGEKLSGETVSVDGEEIGQTNQDGEITVSIPYQDNLTLSTSYSGIQDKTYEIQGEAQEPEIVLDNPFDTESFNTQTGTNKDVTFEADVEITEDSGTASLMIDGSEAYTQDLSSGTNSISTTQALSGGTHNWQVEVDTPEYNVSSSSRSLTINEEDVQNGLSLSRDPVAEESVTVQLYQDNEPVEGEKILVNGNDYGQTDSSGELIIQVPNEQEITISTETGIDEITKTVEGYAEPKPQITINSPTDEETINNYEHEFDFSVSAPEEGFDTTLILNGEERYTKSTNGDSEGFKKNLIIGDSGNHDWKVEVTQNGETYESNNTEFETTEDIPQPSVSILNPNSGDNMDSNTFDIAFEYDTPMAHNLKVMLGDQTLNNTDYPEGTSRLYQREVSVPDGSYTWNYSISYHNTSKIYEGETQFSVNAGSQLADVQFIYPSSDVEENPEGELSFDISTYDSVRVEAIFNNSDNGDKRTAYTGEFDSGSSENVVSSHNIDYNTFDEWYLNITSETSSEFETTETVRVQ